MSATQPNRDQLKRVLDAKPPFASRHPTAIAAGGEPAVDEATMEAARLRDGVHPDANSMVSLEPKLTVCALNALMLESKTAAQV